RFECTQSDIFRKCDIGTIRIGFGDSALRLHDLYPSTLGNRGCLLIMDISDRIARILGFQQIQLVEKDAMIEQLQAKINELEKQRDLMLKEGRNRPAVS